MFTTVQQRQPEVNEVRVAGRWYATGHTSPHFEGVCGKCGVVRPAIELELRQLPWGRGEVWACKGGC
jgi:hypothetical protein